MQMKLSKTIYTELCSNTLQIVLNKCKKTAFSRQTVYQTQHFISSYKLGDADMTFDFLIENQGLIYLFRSLSIHQDPRWDSLSTWLVNSMTHILRGDYI